MSKESDDMDQTWTIGMNLPGLSDGQADVVLSRITQMAAAIQIVMIIVGILVCLFGLKLVRVLSVLAGLVIGSGVGTGAALGLGFSGTMIPVTILICTIVTAVLCGGVRKLGIFFVVFLYTFGIGGSLLLPGVRELTALGIILGISLAAALLMAILAMIRPEPIVVVVTGISGGLSVGTSAAAVLGIGGNLLVGYGISAAAALIGIWIQFMMQSRTIGKNERVYAKRMKDQVSRESEVEKARKILEEEEEEEESPKKGKTAFASAEEDEEDDDITIISEDL